MNDPFDDMTPGAEAYEMDEEDAGQDSAALEAAMAEIAALKEQMLRVAADAENAKRRAEREANDARAFAIQKFARDLMGVADNLSRALQHAAGGHVVGRLFHHRLVEGRIELFAPGRVELFQAVALKGVLQGLFGHVQADDQVLDRRIGVLARGVLQGA